MTGVLRRSRTLSTLVAVTAGLAVDVRALNTSTHELVNEAVAYEVRFAFEAQEGEWRLERF